MEWSGGSKGGTECGLRKASFLPTNADRLGGKKIGRGGKKGVMGEALHVTFFPGGVRGWRKRGEKGRAPSERRGKKGGVGGRVWGGAPGRGREGGGGKGS